MVPMPGESQLRSSAASEDGRCLTLDRLRCHALADVAILGRLGRRPLPSSTARSPPPRNCCDPRPPRKTAAARAFVPAVMGHPGSCDPRPPRKTAAASPGIIRSTVDELRSSAASEDGRCTVPAPDTVGQQLRSSAASEDGRCLTTPATGSTSASVAILGRLGRRPLLAVTSCDGVVGGVAILGRLGRRPLPVQDGCVLRRHRRLRSSAASEDGRCSDARVSLSRSCGSCDPRPPRKTAAAARRLRSSRRASLRCDPRPPRKTAAATDRPRFDGVRPRCDPRPPRKTAAALRGTHPGSVLTVAILGRLGRRPLRASASTTDAVAVVVAILGRLGRRPLPSSRRSYPRHPKLRSSAASEDGRCPRNQFLAVRDRPCCCDPRPPRKTAAATDLDVRRATTMTGCDPRPPRKTAAALRRQRLWRIAVDLGDSSVTGERDAPFVAVGGVRRVGRR